MPDKKQLSREDIILLEHEKRGRELEHKAEIAAALIEDPKYTTLKEFLDSESAYAAAALSRLLKNGTRRAKKGDAWIDEPISPMAQLLEAKILAWKCNFLQRFSDLPYAAIRNKAEWDERQKEAGEAIE